MSNDKSTPRPWKLDESFSAFDIGDSQRTVASVTFDLRRIPWHEEHTQGNDPANATSKANAELIVRAVNSHDALVEALEEYMSQFGQALEAHGIVFSTPQQAASDKARAALALAKGE